MLGHRRAGRIIWDFPGPFLRPAPGQPPRSGRGPPLDYWESGYGWGNGTSPSIPSVMLRAYLDRPRDRLLEPFEDPWELAAILRAADRRLGRACLLAWAQALDPAHPALIARSISLGSFAIRPDGRLDQTARRSALAMISIRLCRSKNSSDSRPRPGRQSSESRGNSSSRLDRISGSSRVSSSRWTIPTPPEPFRRGQSEVDWPHHRTPRHRAGPTANEGQPAGTGTTSRHQT
jgi:hypothetical protein